MPDWRNEIRTCNCGARFAPKREKQRHCSARCRNTSVVRRRRSGDKTEDPTTLPRSGDTPATGQPPALSDGPTMVWPAAVQPPGPITELELAALAAQEYYED